MQSRPTTAPMPESMAPRSGATPRGRSFVSASRVLTALRHGLGCRPTGARGPASEYWVTANGVRFLVADATADRESAAVVTANGRRSLYYSYHYAAALLHHASWLAAYGRPEDEISKPQDNALLLEDAVVTAAAPGRSSPGGAASSKQTGARPRDLADLIFI